MSTAAIMSLFPRYCSTAEVSALTGLSVKTVRRRIKDGSLRGVRLGRRVLIPLDAIDRPRTQEVPLMAIAPSTVSPHRSVDVHGRALPMTDDEIRARAGEIARGLDALDDMGDEDEQRQTLEALMAAVDAEPLSDRKRFR